MLRTKPLFDRHVLTEDLQSLPSNTVGDSVNLTLNVPETMVSNDPPDKPDYIELPFLQMIEEERKP